MSTRLHTIAPDLEDALAAASAERCREAAWAAARWAAERAGLPADADTHAIHELAEELDNRYLEMNDGESDSEASVLALFSKARAASAVKFAVLGEPVEAIYEAGIATDDVQTLRTIVHNSLGAQRSA